MDARGDFSMSVSSIVDIEELGRRIRKLRSERRMTLKQVENACGLSATHLSEIERGRTSPTIGALVRIARSLGKDASYFIEQDERPDIGQLHREQSRALSAAPGVTAEPMTHGIPGSRLHAYRITVAGELAIPALSIPGDALYLVRRGPLDAEIGEERCTLDEGDSMQATLMLPHRLRGRAASPAELIAVFTRPLEEPV
jgi:transcriptional regulator with XRE-family HTH domain